MRQRGRLQARVGLERVVAGFDIQKRKPTSGNPLPEGIVQHDVVVFAFCFFLATGGLVNRFSSKIKSTGLVPRYAPLHFPVRKARF